MRYGAYKLILNEHRPKIYYEKNAHNCSCDWSDKGSTDNFLYNIESSFTIVLARQRISLAVKQITVGMRRRISMTMKKGLTHPSNSLAIPRGATEEL